VTPSRIFLFTLLSFIFGVALRSFFYIPFYLLFPFALATGIAFAFGVRTHAKKYMMYAFVTLAFSIGIFRYDQILNTAPHLSSYFGKSIQLSGMIISEPEREGSAQRISLRVRSIDGNSVGNVFNVFLATRSYPRYDIGDRLEVRGRLDDPHDSRIPGYADRVAREDIFALMYFPMIQKTGEESINPLTSILITAKRSFDEKIDLILPEPHAAFLKGLLLGERQDLPQSLRNDFATTGTTHIVALSGYNITLVGGLFMSILLFFTVPFTLAFWLSSAAIILFVLLTGASPSVVRAGIMGILLLIAEKEGRLYHMGNALAFAATVMVWVNPRLLLFDAAFQLSFLATIGISYLTPVIERAFERIGAVVTYMGKRSRFKNSLPMRDPVSQKGLFSLRRTLIETISAQIAVIPLLMYLFGRLSLISPLTNLLVLIAVPYAMAAGFIAACAAFISVAFGQVMGWGAWVLLEYMIRMIELFSRLPFASVAFDSPWAIGIGWFFFASLFIVLVRGGRLRNLSGVDKEYTRHV